MSKKCRLDTAFKSDLFNDLSRIENIESEIHFLKLKHLILMKDFERKLKDLLS